MLKKLQLYTVCIIIVVIVLSQFTLFNRSINIDANEEEQIYSQSFIDEIKESKYAQPFNEIKCNIEALENSIEEYKRNLESIKDFLDIEKNIKEFTESIM